MQSAESRVVLSRGLTHMIAPPTADADCALQALPVPALILDPDGRVVASNGKLEALAGRIDPPGIRTWWELMSACGVDALVARSSLLTRKTPIELHLDFHGQTWPCEVLTAPCDGDRRIVIFWHAAERPQRDARFRASVRMEAMQSVALHISNTFNNVLAAIAGHIQSSRSPDAEASVELDHALAAVERAARAVRGLQRVVRPLPSVRRLLDPGTVVQSAMDAVGEAWPPGVTVDLTTDHGDWQILGDAQQLVDVLVNVLSNARDAVGGSGSIAVRTLQHSSTGHGGPRPAELHTTPFVGIDIADTGVGIPSDVLPRIFEPYFSTKGQAGLGLAGVYQVLKQHAGGVQVESRPHDGTTFHLFLPQAVGVTESDTQSSAPVATADAGTILVVDDDPAIRRVLARTLERVGYSVLQAAGGTEGLEMLRSHGPAVDLVVLDVIMPDLSGWEVLTAIQKERDVPRVIIQSGFMTEVDDDAAALADAFLRKPYELDEFLDTVRRVLGGPETVTP